MTPELKKQIAAGVLIVGVVAVVLYQFVLKGSGGSSTTPSRTSATSPAAKVALVKVDVDLDALLSGIEVVNFVYENEKIDRDPMTPVRPIPSQTVNGEGGSVTPLQSDKVRMIYDMKVTGIIYSDYRPMAIVDDELVTIGKEYGEGIRIVAIDRDRVWFDVDDARYPLELKEL